MKQTFILAFLLITALIGNAAILSNKTLAKGEKMENVIVDSKEMTEASTCTVTISGSLKIAGSGIEVTCTATSDDCTTATTDASNCLKTAIRLVKAALQ